MRRAKIKSPRQIKLSKDWPCDCAVCYSAKTLPIVIVSNSSCTRRFSIHRPVKFGLPTWWVIPIQWTGGHVASCCSTEALLWFPSCTRSSDVPILLATAAATTQLKLWVIFNNSSDSQSGHIVLVVFSHHLEILRSLKACTWYTVLVGGVPTGIHYI